MTNRTNVRYSIDKNNAGGWVLSSYGLKEVEFSGDIVSTDFKGRCLEKRRKLKNVANDDIFIGRMYNCVVTYQDIDKAIIALFCENVSENDLQMFHASCKEVGYETFSYYYKLLGSFGIKTLTRSLQRHIKANKHRQNY